MNYQVLARKWRPHGFAEVVGQQHVLQALTNTLNQQRLHHAYLFSGTRGVGKTTIARIFAKCLNCEVGVSATPCNKCSACQEVDQGRFIDLIEVDAASRTKVEDTRELLDNVLYPPVRGRYKVYLIDEVHMLSGHSFNALLKTLEEPPAHVIFLLATTDPQKLPVTVLSRCLQFHLKSMPEEYITAHLQQVLQQEKITFEPTALTLLAKAAAGSMRDALSLLDQTIAFCNNDITVTATRSLLGTIDDHYIIELLYALANNDSNKLLTISQELSQQAPDFANVLEELLTNLHHMAITQIAPDIMLDTTYIDEIKSLAKTITAEDIQLFYQIGLMGRKDLPLAPNPRIGFEMALLRMLAFRPSHSEYVATPINTTNSKPVITTSNPPQSSNVKVTPAVAITQNDTNEFSWLEICPKLPLSGIVKMIAAHCALVSFADNKLELSLDSKQAALLTDKYHQTIALAINQYLNKSILLTITVKDELLDTPTRVNAQNKQTKQQQAVATLNADPNIQHLQQQFGATLLEGSVEVQDD